MPKRNSSFECGKNNRLGVIPFSTGWMISSAIGLRRGKLSLVAQKHLVRAIRHQ